MAISYPNDGTYHTHCCHGYNGDNEHDADNNVSSTKTTFVLYTVALFSIQKQLLHIYILQLLQVSLVSFKFAAASIKLYSGLTSPTDSIRIVVWEEENVKLKG